MIKDILKIWLYFCIGATVVYDKALADEAGRNDETRAILAAPICDQDYYDNGKPPAAKVELGRMLFFDKILSGNTNIACATCHHPRHAGSDGVSLSFGEGPQGVGQDRKLGDRLTESIHGRVPRNAPALFNRGAREFVRMFWDGRVEVDDHGYYDSGFITPAKWKLPVGIENVLAAQAMFPVATSVEMAGQKGENPVADAVALNNVSGPGGVWEQLAGRLQDNPQYVAMFKAAFPGDISAASQITFVHAANAIAAFEATAFRSDDSPFDRWLCGDDASLTESQRRGLDLFYGEAGCVDCHSGKFQTDQEFHSIAMPQIGPGKSDGSDGSYWRASGHKGFVEDHGRGRITFREEDRFKFKTPSLRNVALSGPWGHAGAFDRLESVIRHHADSIASLERYRPTSSTLPPITHAVQLTASQSSLFTEWMPQSRLGGFLMRDSWVSQNSKLRQQIAITNEIDSIDLSDGEVDDLLAFMHALTGESVSELESITPFQVPSGLPVDR